MKANNNNFSHEIEESNLETSMHSRSSSSSESSMTVDGNIFEQQACSSTNNAHTDYHLKCMNFAVRHDIFETNDLQLECRREASHCGERNKEFLSERGDGGDIAKNQKISKLLIVPRQSEKNVTVMNFTSFFKGILGFDSKRTPRKVRFRLPEDGFGVEMDDGEKSGFDGRATPIPDIWIPCVFCKTSVADKVYKRCCCLKYRQGHQFQHELLVTVKFSYREKSKDYNTSKDMLFSYIRLIYWSYIQQIRKTIDFRQPDREENEIGQIATKMWLFAFVLKDLFAKKDLTESTNKNVLITYWEHFITVRQHIWIQINKAVACYQNFRVFTSYTHKKIKKLGRWVGLNINMEKSVYEYNYGDGLQLMNTHKQNPKDTPLKLQFEEKLSATWFDFTAIPEEEQYKFLHELLEEVKHDMIHVQVQIDFLLEEIMAGKQDKDSNSFYKNLKIIRDSFHYFLTSSSTSATAYENLRKGLRQFSEELLQVIKSIRYIFLRIMEVCDITELSAIYLSNEFTTSGVLPLEPKFNKHCLRRRKLYKYKEAYFMQAYFKQYLLTNTVLNSRHCRLRLRSQYSIDVKDSHPTLPSAKPSRSPKMAIETKITHPSAPNLQTPGTTKMTTVAKNFRNSATNVKTSRSTKIPIKSPGNKKDEIVAHSSNRSTKVTKVPISIYGYLESPEYKLRSILRKDTYVGPNVLSKPGNL